MLMRIMFIAVMFPCSLGACAQEQPGVRVLPAQSPTVSAQAGGVPALVRMMRTVDVQPDATMLRYPDVSATHIVFVYANDIWLVPREGGQASPLASPPGQESLPKFSDDGRTIAFAGNYDGNRDLYTIPVTGGVPMRVTHHPAPELLCGWTPDGKLLFSTGAFAGLQRQMQLATVSAAGGMPTKLPIPYGVMGAISPDGRQLAYTPETRDFSTWKRYRGGMATDIWIFDLQDLSARKITDWEGTDSLPMWHGRDVYYMSDAGPEHRLNIWRWDGTSGKRHQITDFAEYDVKWPSIGPGPDSQGEIVFQNGSQLYLLDLATGVSQIVKVTVPGDRPKIRPHQVDAGELITAADISSTGKRAALEARGDIWTAPAQKGPPRNLTRTCDVAERDPAWSPDGQWIAYFSDATGEYQLYVTQSDGKGETKQLTQDGETFYFSPTWSPDSKHILFFDKAGAIRLCTIESGETKLIDTDPYASRHPVSWSHDSRWLAYAKTADSRLLAIWLYNVESGESHQVTSGRFTDTWPTFDRKGDYLFFASNRKFIEPAYADIGGTFIYANTDMLLVVPLRDEVGSPWAPESDEETWGDEKEEDEEKDADNDDGQDKADEESDKKKPSDADENDKDKGEEESDDKESADDDKDDEEKKEEAKPVEIELEGFEHRAIPLPVKKGGFTSLAVNHEGKLLYARGALRGTDGKPSIQIFDPEEKDEEKAEKTVIEGTGWFVMSADGKKLLVSKDKTRAIVDAAADQKLDKPMSVTGIATIIDPRAEWRQMFLEAWRLQRDFFYDPHMHGVDWPAVRERYGKMIDHCASRRDVSFVIGEMIAELNVGHAYVWSGGDTEKGPKVSVGMLGADFELHDGAYSIAKIVEGAPWDVDARSPLSQPGVDVKEGDYLLAVNGVPLDTTKDPWAAFAGLADKVVTLTVSDKPTIDDEAREIIIKTLGDERDLRYRAWVEHNRAYVDEQTGGRVGYIHVPDTGINGQNELFRQFYGQTDKEALIIDERWNGGGQVPHRFIELLNRPLANYWTRRHGKDTPSPSPAHFGPKCMLINGPAGSGGDCFPYYFRQVKLGKLIGTRTWGGLVGISGNPGLIDGGAITVPRSAFYETDGTWGVEGHGVDPDIEVIDDPALMTDGGDPQLDAAIEHMLSEIKRNPYKPAPRPTYPDRSGMGIRKEDI